MKNKSIIVSVIILVLIIIFSFLIIQNMNINEDKQDDLYNQPTNVSSNSSNDNISENLSSSDNLNSIALKKDNKKNKVNKTDSPFYIPKNAKLSYSVAKKIADSQNEKGEYSKITKTFKNNGILYWYVEVYDKKTGKMIDTYAIDDKHGSLESMW